MPLIVVCADKTQSSRQCHSGLIPLEEWFVLQQVDWADKLYVVTEPRVRKHLDPRALCWP